MDEAQVKRLIESELGPLKIENTRLREQVARFGAPVKIREALNGVRLPPATQQRIIERIGSNVPLTEAGAIDEPKLKTLVEAEVKAEADYLTALTGRVVNLGPSAGGTTADTKEAAKLDEQHQEEFKETMNDTADIFCENNSETPKDIAKQRRKLFREGRAA